MISSLGKRVSRVFELSAGLRLASPLRCPNINTLARAKRLEMQLGPFDRRKKRSRCQACAASHLKVRALPPPRGERGPPC